MTAEQNLYRWMALYNPDAWQSVAALSNKLNIHPTSVRRYFALWRQRGRIINKRFAHGRYLYRLDREHTTRSPL